MYEIYPCVLNELYKKNIDVHAHNTRRKDTCMFHIAIGSFHVRSPNA